MFGEGQGNEGRTTSAVNGRRTAGCSGQRRRDERGNARGEGGTDALARRASRARYRDEFHSPDRFRRRGRDAEGRFRDPGIRGIPNPRRLRSVEPGIRETVGGTYQGVESCRRDTIRGISELPLHDTPAKTNICRETESLSLSKKIYNQY